MRILLLRHATTDMVDTHLCGDEPGIRLNGLGRKQAAALARRIPPVDALLSSPIDRALETARIVGALKRLRPKIVEEFREFDFGRWAGKRFTDLARDPQWRRFEENTPSVRAPGGESMRDVRSRSVSALEAMVELNNRNKTIVVVSHSAIIRALLTHAADAPLRNYWRFTSEPASISELQYDGARGFYIRRVNDCAHLEHLAEETLQL